MSTTDEMREWTKGFMLAVADRIDAEYEEAIRQVLMGEGGVPATDEKLVRDMWHEGMCECGSLGKCAACMYEYPTRMRELGVEVDG